MRKWKLCLNRLVVALVVCGTLGAVSGMSVPGYRAQTRMVVGWVIGTDGNETAVILHTKNGGKKWTVQGDNTHWVGYEGADISAVDRKTAWAALSGVSDGKILHTTNGGKEWVEQEIPGGLGPMKQIKGLSRKVAWAATLDGTVLHTTDGGKSWHVVPHQGVAITQVNRMDVRGLRNADIRIADDKGERWGMVHSQDNGKTWRREYVDYPYDYSGGIHMLASHSRNVAWCAAWFSGTLFRTDDGGDTWVNLGTISGPDDLDDMVSPKKNILWAVQNLSGGSGGSVFRVKLKKDGSLKVKQFRPTTEHIFEGISYSSGQQAVVVGSRAVGVPDTVPFGIIVKTVDGGKHWKIQDVPVDDVACWKVSFVGVWR